MWAGSCSWLCNDYTVVRSRDVSACICGAVHQFGVETCVVTSSDCYELRLTSGFARRMNSPRLLRTSKKAKQAKSGIGGAKAEDIVLIQSPAINQGLYCGMYATTLVMG